MQQQKQGAVILAGCNLIRTQVIRLLGTVPLSTCTSHAAQSSSLELAAAPASAIVDNDVSLAHPTNTGPRKDGAAVCEGRRAFSRRTLLLDTRSTLRLTLTYVGSKDRQFTVLTLGFVNTTLCSRLVTVYLGHCMYVCRTHNYMNDVYIQFNMYIYIYRCI